MDISLGPGVQSKLERLAAEWGLNAESLAREAIERFVNYDEWFMGEVEKGVDQIAHGGILSHEQVGSRLEKLLIEKQPRK
jgi:predicted transcriptional regulator